MSALICGSLAYDTIMVFPGRFKEHILPDKVHILNVSFMVPQIRREYGGCAGNIAYNLDLLGGEGYIMATAGQDFEPYSEWLEQRGIYQRYIKKIPDEFTAQAFVTTDLDDNQITAFHPGAMNCSHENKVPGDAGISIAIISPDGKEGMVQHASQCHEAGIPFIFDPGQGMPMFNGDELLVMVEQASYICLNDYESELLQERTGLGVKQIAELVEAMVVTYGSKGSVIHADGASIEIPAVWAGSVQDPTGCGDAYRGGLLFGLMKGLDWEVSGRIASLISAIKVAHPGTQNHTITLDAFKERFEKEFGYAF
ncbi:MAG: carbohydrate kinase family protein [Gammaproteobacteria bacterium]|nr:carbohydrate kinase family protein [Gammaproteobacteria bacterium]